MTIPHIPIPQRPSPPAKPGELLKRLDGARRWASSANRETDPSYLAMVRQCPCLKCGLDPCGEAAHVRMNAGRKRQALGKKPDDKFTLPLCPSCHTRDPDSQHKVGEAIFWDSLGINPIRVCTTLHAQRGDLVAMRAVCFVAIAERESASQIGEMKR